MYDPEADQRQPNPMIYAANENRRLSTVRNAATNARWFLAMLFVLALKQNDYPLAVICAASVGIAVIADLRPAGSLVSIIAGLAAYAVAFLAIVLTVANLIG